MCVCVCVCITSFLVNHPLITFRLLLYLGNCNNIAMNIGVHVSFQISDLEFFSDMYPGVELLGHMVVLGLPGGSVV